jgi:hypothetical protein
MIMVAVLWAATCVVLSNTTDNFTSSSSVGSSGAQYCQLEGSVPDCNCDFNSVNGAVKNFLQPLLKDLTSRYVQFTPL